MRLKTGSLMFVLILAACGNSAERDHSLVGRVTKVDQQTICVGAPAATGQCFATDAVTKVAELDACVRVTYAAADDESGPYIASSLRRLSSEAPSPCGSK